MYVQVTTVGAATLTVSDPHVREIGCSRLAPKIGQGLPGATLNRISSSGPGRTGRFRPGPPLAGPPSTMLYGSELQPELQPCAPAAPPAR